MSPNSVNQQFYFVGEFHEGLAKVRKGRYWGFIDEGYNLLNNKFFGTNTVVGTIIWAGNFHDNFAAIRCSLTLIRWSSFFYLISNKGNTIRLELIPYLKYFYFYEGNQVFLLFFTLNNDILWEDTIMAYYRNKSKNRDEKVEIDFKIIKIYKINHYNIAEIEKKGKRFLISPKGNLTTFLCPKCQQPNIAGSNCIKCGN